MFCRLCQQNAELQNSHIIPEFFYKQIYDALHRCHFISTEAATRESYVQKGLREPLLCKSCESKFSRWEHYAKTAFVDAQGVKITRSEKKLVLDGVEYKTFKLFLLSLLWRMGVSTLNFYKEVDLGPHEAKLRRALLNDDPLKPEQYPCVLIAVQIDGKFCHDWILEPSLVRFAGLHCHRLVVSGILFAFFVASHFPAAIKPLLLDHRNQLAILVDDIRNIPFLTEAALKFGAAINHRNKTAAGVR